VKAPRTPDATQQGQVVAPHTPDAAKQGEGLQQEAESCESLWDRAYQELRDKKGDLVDAFENLLMSEPEIESTASLDNADASKREKQMSALVDKKLAIMNKEQWRFKVGGKSVEVREQVDRIVKVVLVAKDFISSAAIIDLIHAGLPWAGVCMLLDVIYCP
jgi:N-terminal domain of NWD NACHT-NTPase